MKLPKTKLLLGFLIVGLPLAGCSQEPVSAPPVAVEETVVEEVEVPALTTGDDTDPLAAMSEADRAAVLAQKVCPVSDEPLGSMGTPVKVTVDGRDVFLCCEGCRKQFEANPKEFLAKLDDQK